jgi:hypothetical protein
MVFSKSQHQPVQWVGVEGFDRARHAQQARVAHFQDVADAHARIIAAWACTAAARPPVLSPLSLQD